MAPNPNNEDKTTFITPNSIYFYMVMTFDLKNAVATYQKAIQKCISSQIGKNIGMWLSRPLNKTSSSSSSPRPSPTYENTSGSLTRPSASLV
jgi:hypothetical protein